MVSMLNRARAFTMDVSEGAARVLGIYATEFRRWLSPWTVTLRSTSPRLQSTHTGSYAGRLIYRLIRFWPT